MDDGRKELFCIFVSVNRIGLLFSIYFGSCMIMKSLKYIFLLLVFFFTFPINVTAENIDMQHLESLKQKMNSCVSSKERFSLADQMLRDAEAVHVESYVADACLCLACKYRNASNDSMNYFIHKAYPIFMKEKRYDEAVSLKSMSIYKMITSGGRDSVTMGIKNLQSFGKQHKNQFALDASNQLLAFYYWTIGPRTQSRNILANMVSSQEKRHAPLMERPDILMQAVNTVESPEDRAFYLAKLKSLLNAMKRNQIVVFNRIYPFRGNNHTWASLAQTYFKMSALMHYDYPNASLMLEDLKQLDPIIEEYHLDPLVSKYLWMLYYYKSGDFQKAVTAADTLIGVYVKSHNVSNMLTVIETKSRILSDMGKYKESLALYRSYTALKDSINDSNYYSQLADLQSKLDINKLEVKNKEMQLLTQKDQANMKMMRWGSVSLGIIIVLLIFAVVFYRRNTRLAMAARKAAEDEANMRSAFLANMNHEIRTPLNVIDGFSQLLVESNDVEERKNYAGIIHSNNELMQRLVKDVLDLSKLESNKLLLKETPFELVPMMHELYESTLIRMPDGVKLILTECEPIVFTGDRGRLLQVLNNLIGNAIKHTLHGSITFGYVKIGETVRFDVKDTGEGISEDKVNDIFSRFVQLNDWTAGVGLGLAISRGLVEQMKGEIGVVSKVGEGSDFYVVLPIHEERE